MSFKHSAKGLGNILSVASVGLLALVGATACDSSGANPSAQSSSNDAGNVSILPPQGAGQRTYKREVLLYDGDGTAHAEAANIQTILADHGVGYDVVSSAELNSLSLDDISSYGTIVWPGGLAKTMNDSLTASARAKVLQAVKERGVSYVGFCAGSFIAGTSNFGGSTWGLGLSNLDFPYYYLENQGTDLAMVNVSMPDGSHHDLVWYGGPQLLNFGQTVAKYPDGTAAIAQGWIGKGFVILSGPHPESPDAWRAGMTDSDGTQPDRDLAFALFDAALKQKMLSGF